MDLESEGFDNGRFIRKALLVIDGEGRLQDAAVKGLRRLHQHHAVALYSFIIAGVEQAHAVAAGDHRDRTAILQRLVVAAVNEFLAEQATHPVMHEHDPIFAHQLQPKYQYAHRWTEGDVLMWDHIGTLHNAIPQVFFHITAAYAILRHNGVPVGKSDFTGA
ncbi:MAG: DUF1993 family protein [Sphingobacteriales bacterium]|nr:MAG: DUF1993 family protein [Sphingobacteriales bacterium]